MNLRLLLVEPDPEEALFLKDVLADIEEGRHFRTWVHLEPIHASTWEEAAAILSTEKIDVVLLNPCLPDCQGFETFRRSRAIAPAVPVVLLLDAGNEALGVRIVREGAQDFLIRGQVDCAPLAHALRNAVERERLVAAEQTVRFIAPLTGLANLCCFDMFAERDRKLAERLGVRWMILLAELIDLGEEVQGDQRRDLDIVQLGELLRGVTNPADLLYHVSPTRFVLTVFETDHDSLTQAQDRVERALAGERVVVGSATFHPGKPVSLEELLEDAEESMTAVRIAKRTAGAA
jgi:DNA-binding NarL/FixJ family response regulator